MIQAYLMLSTNTNTVGPSVADKVAGGSFQATVTGTGAVTATVLIECTVNGSNWLTLGTITLTGTTVATDGFSSQGQWCQYRATTSNVTGTGATVSVHMSEES